MIKLNYKQITKTVEGEKQIQNSECSNLLTNLKLFYFFFGNKKFDFTLFGTGLSDFQSVVTPYSVNVSRMIDPTRSFYFLSLTGNV